MIIAQTHRNSLSASLAGLRAAYRAWRIERANMRALESLSNEQLKDIGFRRVPSEPPRFERMW